MSNAATQTATPQQLRSLFYAVSPAAREFAPGSTDLRLARVQIAGEWVTLGGLSGLEIEALVAATRGTSYTVRYFDAKRSRRGKRSVVTYEFGTREAAEEFAKGKTLYSMPAVVSEVTP